MALLFEPLTIRSIILKNRISVSPMCEYSSTDGHANDWHLVHLGSRAVGGAGLVIAEATAVTPEGRITPGDLGIWKDDHIPCLKRIARFISDHVSVPGIQLAHAGRKASSHVPWKGGKPLQGVEGSWTTLAPSAIPFRTGDPVPRPMTIDDIAALKDDFVKAAERALEAGFKLIEIHAAHGYLFHEFLSPLTNQRSDKYGGSFENRCRLLLETVAAVRSAMPGELPLFVRISATDWIAGGWTPEESVSLARMLKAAGVDLLDCSSGGIVPGVKIPVAPLYQVHLAEKVKKEAGVLTGAVGLITTPAEAESILEHHQADLILLARQMLRDPYFALHAAKELGVDIPWPVQYERAKL